MEPEAAAVAKQKGDVLPYKEGYEIPPGYHKEERNRRGLVLAGGLTLGVSWGLSALVGASLWGESNRTPYGALVVPVAGPFIVMAGANYDSLSGVVLLPLLIVDGLAQTGGLVMLIVGLQSRTVLVRDGVALEQPKRPLSPELIVGPGSLGMRMHF